MRASNIVFFVCVDLRLYLPGLSEHYPPIFFGRFRSYVFDFSGLIILSGKNPSMPPRNMICFWFCCSCLLLITPQLELFLFFPVSHSPFYVSSSLYTLCPTHVESLSDVFLFELLSSLASLSHSCLL